MEANRIDRVLQNPDGSYRWSCRIDTDFHRQSAKKGVWGCVIIVAFIMILFACMPSTPGMTKEIWIPLIPVAVVLMIALPLLYLQYTAKDPHGQYEMNEDCVKSGYGKEAVYSEFKKIERIDIAPGYIELIRKHRNHRIYVPAEDMELVREFIIKRLPEGAEIRYV